MIKKHDKFIIRGNDLEVDMKRLIKNIVNGSFAWEKYCKRAKYYGYYISVLPLHCSYGMIGYTVSIDITTNVQGKIEYDWEKGEIRLFDELVKHLENEIEQDRQLNGNAKADQHDAGNQPTKKIHTTSSFLNRRYISYGYIFHCFLVLYPLFVNLS